jgi:hypothetical protein
MLMGWVTSWRYGQKRSTSGPGKSEGDRRQAVARQQES